MDIAALRDARPGDLYGAADAYDRLHTAFQEHTSTWKRGTADRVHQSQWTGQAATGAMASIDGTTGKLQAAGIELALIGAVLRDGAEAFELARAKLLQALADAHAKDLGVSERGDVSWEPLDPRSRHDPDAADYERTQQAAARDIGDRIGLALREAAEADRTTAERLRRYTANATSQAGLDLATASGDSAAAALAGPGRLYAKGLPPEGATPTQVNSWWRGLTPDEQQRLIAAHPEQLGNRDGIPAAVRDRVNQQALGKLIEQLQAQPHPSDEERARLRRYESVRDRLAADDKLAADPAADHPRDYLLGIGTEGQGRAIISFGNPDTATDVSAYVPGMTTTLGSLGTFGRNDVGANEGDNALNVWRATRAQQGPGGSAASIVWLGYDAPPGMSDAASGDRGKAGAPAYANFLTGIRASHEGGRPPHITSIGHSYGSYLVGQATMLATRHRDTYLPPDDVIIVGSPGTGAAKAADLGLPGRVWVGAAAYDGVTNLPSKNEVAGGLVGSIFGPVGTVVGAGIGHATDSDELWLGSDPADADFGGKRFSVADGSVAHPQDTHLEYLTPQNGGPSLDNIGAVVAGHGDRAQLVAGR
ncbi:alpha/beta hydrolase family protein [Kitasatospora sp. NBC_00240]|uniref:alpha/beta hydrolase n=1 Tax=Kitasatospora sp. NBC_00240 TaxID=2903567 RepID=UPI0022540D80|nr:alpha/beta hydrolase [Kitasatospora sp. NBC_00240]MCX5208736.1 alpha/beta hydrolase family protein [Kitasatospora sp. NBC_00240]